MDDEKTLDNYQRILPALTKHLESNPEQLRDVLKYIIIHYRLLLTPPA